MPGDTRKDVWPVQSVCDRLQRHLRALNPIQETAAVPAGQRQKMKNADNKQAPGETPGAFAYEVKSEDLRSISRWHPERQRGR